MLAWINSYKMQLISFWVEITVSCFLKNLQRLTPLTLSLPAIGTLLPCQTFCNLRYFFSAPNFFGIWNLELPNAEPLFRLLVPKIPSGKILVPSPTKKVRSGIGNWNAHGNTTSKDLISFYKNRSFSPFLFMQRTRGCPFKNLSFFLRFILGKFSNLFFFMYFFINY
jgi:hypothetical protein